MSLTWSSNTSLGLDYNLKYSPSTLGNLFSLSKPNVFISKMIILYLFYRVVVRIK